MFMKIRNISQDPKESATFFPGHDDLSRGIGIGVGLAFLLAERAAEFNKMTELRAEMEMLVKEIRYEVRRKDVFANSSESNNNISLSPSCSCGNTHKNRTTSIPDCNDYFDLQDAKCDFECRTESNYATAFANARSPCMHQMEAELELQLERLQLNLEREGSSALQHRMVVYYV